MTLWYNEGCAKYGNQVGWQAVADDILKDIAAHEWGHTVLQQAISTTESWTHKGKRAQLTWLQLSRAVGCGYVFVASAELTHSPPAFAFPNVALCRKYHVASGTQRICHELSSFRRHRHYVVLQERFPSQDPHICNGSGREAAHLPGKAEKGRVLWNLPRLEIGNLRC
jgi:hypothetical protein